jgi:hypothetical protein
MTSSINIEQRKPIWAALSEFYLDTELQDSDFLHIAFTIIESPYALEEVKTINKYEVFPVLQGNLLSPAGEWAGFDQDWLAEKIIYLLGRKSKINKIATEITYPLFKWMFRSYWKKLELIYADIKQNPDTYVVACRTAFVNNLLPFQFEKAALPLYKKIEQTVLDYKAKGQLQQFKEYLNKGQYHINIWTAYFLIEHFEAATEKTSLNNGSDNIIEYCYRLIENNFQNFKDKEQIKNCSFWLEKKESYTTFSAN